VTNDDPVSNALVAAYRTMHAAMVDGDTEVLQASLSPDFTLAHMTGYVQPRDEWLQHIQSGQMRYFASTEDSVSVTVEAKSARLRGQNRVRADIWGARGTWPLQLDIDFELRDGVWLMTQARASTY